MSQRRVMGWLRLVGSLKLQVSFAKKPCKRNYILQKRPILWRSLLIEPINRVCIECHRKELCHTSEWDMLQETVMSHMWMRHVTRNKTHRTHKSIWINQSSKPCTVLQYPSRKKACHTKQKCHTSEWDMYHVTGIWDWNCIHMSHWNMSLMYVTDTASICHTETCRWCMWLIVCVCVCVCVCMCVCVCARDW